MRLMCIHAFPFYNKRPRTEKDPKAPDVFDEVIAIDTITYKGKDFYLLAGYPDDELYDAECFAILPDQSADEMADQEKEAIVNLETVPA